MIKNLNKGFTLMEIVIYMGIFSTLLIVLSTFFSSIVDQQLDNKKSATLDSDYAFITSRLIYESKNTSVFLTPSTLGDESQLMAYESLNDQRIIRIRGNDIELVTSEFTEKLNSNFTKVKNASFKRIGNLNGRQAIEFKATLESKIKDERIPDINIKLILSAI